MARGKKSNQQSAKDSAQTAPVAATPTASQTPTAASTAVSKPTAESSTVIERSTASPSAPSPSSSSPSSSSSAAAAAAASTAAKSDKSAEQFVSDPRILIQRVWTAYIRDTPQKLQLIDAYMVFILITGIAQFVYCVLVGTFPYNAFLAGFGSTVASFVFAANLRIRTNSANKAAFTVANAEDEENGSDKDGKSARLASSAESSIGEFVFCHVLLHFLVVNFIG
ncbi:DAD-domain-containing protein [Ramicandelaber brevisporus]|nr:DAD-domain-containing protein [Ramicandelaber brevisporus]